LMHHTNNTMIEGGFRDSMIVLALFKASRFIQFAEHSNPSPPFKAY
jgi:hypothetical protein